MVAQHLADPVAYRRDRRKDQLLQENGYLVLRFLAEDLAKELDSVLDGILRALSSRQSRDRCRVRRSVSRGHLFERKRRRGDRQAAARTAFTTCAPQRTNDHHGRR